MLALNRVELSQIANVLGIVDITLVHRKLTSFKCCQEMSEQQLKAVLKILHDRFGLFDLDQLDSFSRNPKASGKTALINTIWKALQVVAVRRQDLLQSRYNNSIHAPSGTYSPRNAYQLNVKSLLQNPRYKLGRCPFVIQSSIIAAKQLPYSVNVSFKLKLTNEQIQQLRTPKGIRTIGLHLRLFTHEGDHLRWSHAIGITLRLNKIIVPIKPSKKHAKKSHIALPLDISPHAMNELLISVVNLSNFVGIVVAELSELHSMDNMIDRVQKRCRGAKTPIVKTCAYKPVCSRTENLLRCSQCKLEWYCCQDHQRRHWPIHSKRCYPWKPPPKLPSIKQNSGDDDVTVGETRISLRCPLTIKRISIPVRGIHCQHPQCFDLRGYLGFCQNTGTWQCPVCTQDCLLDHIGIDEDMAKILATTDEDIDQVRLLSDGTRIPITHDEIREEEATRSGSRKRKRDSSEEKRSESSESPDVKKAYEQSVIILE